MEAHHFITTFSIRHASKLTVCLSLSVWSENDRFVFSFFHITDSDESTEAFLSMSLCSNSITER